MGTIETVLAALTRENALPAVRALARIGYRPRASVWSGAFADAATRASWSTATVVSLSDSIQLKRAAGRPIDQADIEALLTIEEDLVP